ncbi:MAG: hypothetical protein AB7S26_34335 [Sandaracinaceae bacterium]
MSLASVPAPNDSRVVEEARRIMEAHRARQRPAVAIVGAAASAFVSAALWHQLYGRFGPFEWILDAFLASFLGAAVGYSMRSGRIVDRRYSAIAAILGAGAAVSGDMLAGLHRIGVENGIDDYLVTLRAIGGWQALWSVRSPLDHFVMGLAAVAAALASRPWREEMQAVHDAQMALATPLEPDVDPYDEPYDEEE